MSNTTRIRELNDTFRRNFVADQVVITSGVARLPNLVGILSQVRAYDIFRPGDDPYEEHDFGIIQAGEERVYWKIEYYNCSMTAGAENPADEKTCRRIMVVLLSSEY